jgi:hypothetical protein
VAYATTVYPAKVAIKAALEAHVFPGSVPTISWGQPTEPEDVSYDAIYMGPTEVPEDQFLVLGATRLDERYRLSILVDVRQYGDDEQATEARAWELANAVMSVLTADLTVYGTVHRTEGYRFRQSNPVPTPTQWRSQILIEAQLVGLVQIP